MDLRRSPETPFGVFSLVAYLPQPLSGFIEPLRAQLVDGCNARAHVTVLSPRALSLPASQVRKELARQLEEFAPFLVTLGEVCVFPATGVVFLSVESGSSELTDLHRVANAGGAYSSDEHEFHPHVTLAQQSSLPHTRNRAEDAWARYAEPREFTVEKLYLVECTPQGAFWDAAEFALRSAVPA